MCIWNHWSTQAASTGEPESSVWSKQTEFFFKKGSNIFFLEISRYDQTQYKILYKTTYVLETKHSTQSHFKFYFHLGNLYTQHGAQTQEPDRDLESHAPPTDLARRPHILILEN